MRTARLTFMRMILLCVWMLSCQQLAVLDTPIHPWNVPGVPDGFSLHIKRDDLTGCTLSGSKIRRLEFLLADALQQGCRHVITTGSIQSNHCRAVAVAAAQLGLTTHLFLRSDAQDAESVTCTGNVLLDRMCGAHLYMVPKLSAYKTELIPRMEKLAELIEEETGEKSYLIPSRSTDTLNLFGYICMMEELKQQGVLEKFDDLVVACGSGGTAAGLSIGNFLTGSHIRCHGITITNSPLFYRRHISLQLQNVGLENMEYENIVDFIDDYKGLGYGISTEEELDFILSVSRQTGVMLEPTYTGKAVFGLVQELRKNPQRFQGKRILFLHTGGMFGLFDGNLDNTLKRPATANNKVTMWLDKDTVPGNLKLCSAV